MKKIFIIILIFNFLVSCQSVREGFTLKKKSAADEFLVEKKSPLVLPPDYGELPLPGNKQIDDQDNDANDLKKILGKEKNSISSNKKNSEATSIKEAILQKIK